MTTVFEPAREIPCLDAYDVVVLGGGIAGVSAAVAAARRGARVALLEKEYGLGGLATLGNVIVYLPLCDGRGRQVIAGLGEELLKLSVKDVKADEPKMRVQMAPEAWKMEGGDDDRREHRYAACFNPASFQLEMELLLQNEGVEIFYDTRFCACLTEANRVTHVIVENKSGRLAIPAKAFVDASGDADLCAAANEETEALHTNVLCGWHYWVIDGQIKLHCLSKRFNCTLDGGDEPLLAGHLGKDVTKHVLGTRQMVREHLERLRDENPDQAIYPFQLSSIACFRASRRLKAGFSLEIGHVHQWFDDCVGMTGDWRKKGPVFALPFRSIQAVEHPNLFAAGRCMSSSAEAWDVTRVIPTCAVTGEAAGAAAAMTALTHEGNGSAIEISKLQEDLQSRGALIDSSLVEEIS